MTISDAIITQFVNNPGRELNLAELSNATGHTPKVVSAHISRIRSQPLLANLVRTGRGAYTFRPAKSARPYKNKSDQLYHLLKAKKSMTPQQIAKALGVHENQVPELICRMNTNHRVKAKREVRYVI